MRNISKNIPLLYLFNFFQDFKLYSPIAIIYFADITGSFALGMSIFAIAKLSSAVFEVPTGIFSDFLGRKRTVLLGASLWSLAILCYALGFSYWVLVLGAIFEGIGFSFYSGSNQALLYETLLQNKQEAKYPELLGKTSSMFELALGISAVIGGFIAMFSITLVFWLSLLTQLICLVISFFFKEPKIISKKSTNIYSHLKESLSLFRENKKLGLLSIGSIATFGIGESMYNFRSAFISLVWPVWALGISQALTNITAFLGFFNAGRLIKKFSAINVLIFGHIYSRITDFISLLFPTALSPVLMSTNSLFFGTGMTAQGSLMQKEFTPHQRATISSINSLGGSIFYAVFSVILGSIADNIGAANAMLLSTVLLIPVILVYLRVFKLKR